MRPVCTLAVAVVPDPSFRFVAAIAELWRRYFELAWVVEGRSDEYLGGTIGNIANGLTSDLQRNFSISGKTIGQAAAGAKLWSSGIQNVTSLHEDADALLSTVPTSRQQFFRSHILVQAAIQRFSVEIIGALSNATRTLAETATPSAQAVASALSDVNEALQCFDQLFAAQRTAEGTEEWRGMYWADRHRFTNFQARRRETLHTQAVLMELRSGLGKGGDDVQIDCCQMEYAYQWSPAHLITYPNFYPNDNVRRTSHCTEQCFAVRFAASRFLASCVEPFCLHFPCQNAWVAR
eukprot:SAG31_NODE_234_length_19701_cov_16.835068_11_plen_293_part_00